MKIVDTLYNGYTFRTRSEARWAVFFDEIGLRYNYDLESFELNTGIIINPSFYIHDWGPRILHKDKPEDSLIKRGSWVQVYNHEINEEELRNAIFLCSETNKPVFLIYGGVGLPVFRLKDNSWSLVDGHVILVLMPFEKPLVMKKSELENLLKGKLFAGAAGGPDNHVVMCDWCLNAFSGDEESLDIWPIYLNYKSNYKSTEDNQIMFSANNANGTKLRLSNGTGDHVTPIYPFGFTMRMYMGEGRKFDSKFLLKAYQKARSMRFKREGLVSPVNNSETPIEENYQRRNLSNLLKIFDKRFNEEELRTLCFHLERDYDDLPASGKTNKARELISYMVRRERVPELLETCKEYRSDIAWDSILENGR